MFVDGLPASLPLCKWFTADARGRADALVMHLIDDFDAFYAAGAESDAKGAAVKRL